MPQLLADYLLLFAALLSIFSMGVVIVRRGYTTGAIDTLAYGAAAGAVVQAVIGLAIALLPRQRRLFVGLDLALVFCALIYGLRGGLFAQLFRTIQQPSRICLAIWAAFVAACVAISNLDVALPNDLPDGRYVFKTPTDNVKLQYLTILPADNFIPFVVTEYMLRGISFRKEHPILPGQEVTNRTVLLSLVALPYRAAISPPHRFRGSLPRFEYVGRTWPAVDQLYNRAAYHEILIIGILCNSFVLLGLLALFQNSFCDARALIWASVLAATNIYLIT